MTNRIVRLNSTRLAPLRLSSPYGGSMARKSEKTKISEQLTKMVGASFDKFGSPFSGQYVCIKCGVKKKSWNELTAHHVVYEPSYTKYLCRRCHARITYLNTKEARIDYNKLTNEQRFAIWYTFLAEEINNKLYDKILVWFNKQYAVHKKRNLKPKQTGHTLSPEMTAALAQVAKIIKKETVKNG